MMKTPLFNIEGLNRITADLLVAVAALKEAQAAASIARNRECDALNRVNQLTYEYDIAAAALKKSMPRDCHWSKGT